MNSEGPGNQVTGEDRPQPRWQPLDAVQRRVLGVLVEKAKTTPEAYPLTLNALTNGCNQKNNRQPQTNYSTEDVESALNELRQVGAVVEVQSGGRVPKYRHCIYDWMGIDKTEAAIMAELLLRGEQTVGELRGRAARMEPIADLTALKPLLQSLQQKKLVVSLTPEGRGQVVTHALYRGDKVESLRQHYQHHAAAPDPDEARPAAESSAPASSATARPSITRDMFNELQVEVAELRAEVARLRQQVGELVPSKRGAGEGE